MSCSPRFQFILFSILIAVILPLSITPFCFAQTSTKKQVQAYFQQYRKKIKEGKYQESIKLGRKCISEAEEAFGKDHPSVAFYLEDLAKLYIKLKDPGRAAKLYNQALAIREKSLGPKDEFVAFSQNKLALLYNRLSSHEKAEPLFKKALRAYEEIYGPEHLNVASVCNNLGMCYEYQKKYPLAEHSFKRALSIKEKVYGAEHPKLASGLRQLAGFYLNLKNYAKAEPLYKRALSIRRKALTPGHPAIGFSLLELGVLYYFQKDFSKAEALLKRSMTIMEGAFGSAHLNVVRSLDWLGNLYFSQGTYAKAEPFLKRSLDIREKILGSDHPELASGYINLGVIYYRIGAYDKAERLFLKALAINQKHLGPEHPKVALDFKQLADVYRASGDYARSEMFYKKSIAIYEKAHGPEQHGLASSLNGLAELYHLHEKYTEAEPLYQRALAIREKTLGPDHMDVALSLNSLAQLYKHDGDYDKVEHLFQRSVAIYEKTYGAEYPDLAVVFGNLGTFYASSKEFEKAHKAYRRALEIENAHIEQVADFASEDHKTKFLFTVKWRIHMFLSLVQQHLMESKSAKIDALNTWFKRKGIILEAQKRFQEALIYSEDSEAQEIFKKLSRTRSKLSGLVFSGPGKGSLQDYQRRLKNLEKEKELLEEKLSRMSQIFGTKQKIMDADCGRVAKTLPKNTVLLEFVRAEIIDFSTTNWIQDRYLAFVLHAGKGDRVEMISLGNADMIDREVNEFKKEISKANIKNSSRIAEKSKKLCELIFDPLRQALGEKREIFISPDGNLSLIPFEVLTGPDGKYLIEDYTFNYLTAGRDVLGFGHVKGSGEKGLIMGDPDFDMQTEEKKSILKRLALHRSTEQANTKRSSDMRDFHFKRLPGTKEEIKAIKGILGADNVAVYMDREAIEEILFKYKNPSILHLATHGFFLSDPDINKPKNKSRGMAIKQVSLVSKKMGEALKIKNPLLRSGIALAGANHTLKYDNLASNDGIVTAEKILGMKLRGTEMVVLSACETGLGEVKTGEGIYGLRRAFNQAGAKSLVMSMWAIPDRETKELMIHFYRNIRSGKMNRCQALRQAALKEMKIAMKRYGHTNPFFWGGFVFMGEPLK